MNRGLLKVGLWNISIIISKIVGYNVLNNADLASWDKLENS